MKWLIGLIITTLLPLSHPLSQMGIIKNRGKTGLKNSGGC